MRTKTYARNSDLKYYAIPDLESRIETMKRDHERGERYGKCALAEREGRVPPAVVEGYILRLYTDSVKELVVIYILTGAWTTLLQSQSSALLSSAPANGFCQPHNTKHGPHPTRVSSFRSQPTQVLGEN